VTHTECAQRLLTIVDDTEPALRALDAAATGRAARRASGHRARFSGILSIPPRTTTTDFVRAQAPGAFRFPAYAQDDWVARQAYNDRPWPELVTLWSAYNRHLAHVMAHCDPAALETPCTIEYEEPVTLAWLMTDYLDHLHHHLAQLLPQPEQESVR
jgi:hypothetical protein